ncbi:EF-hand domain-containing protein [Mycena indigotica]|uniref:EF-hand domain-containing protein n=1 Tax=Mycena indigotica TaxID=2126181 RepID=A0A8H6W0W6_9AGAR|nr:EF-hand domain-containing protein [Mycena indigotica]KAF7295329.1 EF-hand domain-containing protein [Mycena indigotica]
MAVNTAIKTVTFIIGLSIRPALVSQSVMYAQQQPHYQQHPNALRPQSQYSQQSRPAGAPIYSNHGSQSRHSHTPAPPPGGDPQLFQYFSAVDTDRSGSISVSELQQALVNGNWTRFDLDTVKMLMGIFDTDRSGTISFNEFSGLWKYISDWQNVFRHFDRDGSGSIEGNELASALRSFGYNLSPNLLTLIERKYASAPSTMYGPPPGITFDRFVRACVVVKTLTEAFQRADNDRDGWIQINYESFMSMVLAAP